jgi:hypothetical protein
MAEWSFLTNHARVLVSIAHDPGVRLRDIAATVGITERSAYTPLREASTRERTIGDVLDVWVESGLPHERTPIAEVIGRFSSGSPRPYIETHDRHWGCRLAAGPSA